MELRDNQDEWDIIIRPKENKFTLNLKEVWKYKDLIKMYIRRDFVTMYKQTILGPLWFIIQPVFTTIMFMFVFGGIAQIPTDGIPQPLFYMSGILCWNYFGDCLGRSSSTFSSNAGVFSKVYFPRLTVPVSGLVTNLIRLTIQLLIFFLIYLYFYIKGTTAHFTPYIALFPLILVVVAGIGFGIGIIMSSITAKYRDLAILFGFLTQLWMYATPIIYPLSAVPQKVEKYTWILQINPLTSIVETTRLAFLGEGSFSWLSFGYSCVFAIVISFVGIWMFNKVERNFIDTI